LKKIKLEAKDQAKAIESTLLETEFELKEIELSK
jgi:hypothetical protein